MASTTANVVASWFLWRVRQEPPEYIVPRRISNKKLQKLTYYAQAWHLAEFDAPLFDDPIEAWIHGPVVATLYHEYKRFGFNAINVVIDECPIGDGDIFEHLEDVWSIYGPYDAGYLEILTHEEAPWQLARERRELEGNDIIEWQWMADFYRAMKEEIQASHA